MGYFYTSSYRQSWADFPWANLKTPKCRRAQCRYFHDCLGPEASASNLLVLFYSCTRANKLQGLVDLSYIALSLCCSLCSALNVLFECTQLIFLAAYQINDWNSIIGVVCWLQAGNASDSSMDKALGNQGGWYPCLSHSMILWFSPCLRAYCLFSSRFGVFTLILDALQSEGYILSSLMFSCWFGSQKDHLLLPILREWPILWVLPGVFVSWHHLCISRVMAGSFKTKKALAVLFCCVFFSQG